MKLTSLQKGYVSLVEQACAGIPGFRDRYQQFHQKVVIEQPPRIAIGAIGEFQLFRKLRS